MGIRERLQSRKNDLQEHWELLREKLSGLERDRILENRSEEVLRLDENISAFKERRQAVGRGRARGVHRGALVQK